MEIRCKRCFKKYDDSFPLCPRCGKTSEHKNTNKYNNYQTKAKSEVSSNRSEKKNIDQKMIEEYGEEFKCDVIDKMWFLIVKYVKLPFELFTKNTYCEFCGTRNYHNAFYCKTCKTGFDANYKGLKNTDELKNPSAFRSVLKSFVGSRSGLVDALELESELLKSGFDLEEWNLSGEFKTGTGISKYVIMAIYSCFVGYLFLRYASEGEWGIGKSWFAVVLVLVNLLAAPISRRFFTEYIHIYKSGLSINSNSNRNQAELYSVDLSDVKSIELVFTVGMELQNIIFRAKKGSDIKNLVYSLSVLNYANRNSMMNYIMLSTYKLDISLYITNESEYCEENVTSEDIQNNEAVDDYRLDVISTEHIKKDIRKTNSEILFVRIDKKVDGRTLTELEYTNHISYLDNISSNGYFMGGGFEKESGGMIVFSAIDEIDANEISKDDPLIISGAYTYELKEWNVILKSKRNCIS